MPPIPLLENYLELVAAIEKTARDLKCPVQIEGYEPPHDPRLGVFRLTPDPGVIEVNVSPVTNWKDLVEQTESLYNAAREEHLKGTLSRGLLADFVVLGDDLATVDRDGIGETAVLATIVGGEIRYDAIGLDA